MRRVTLAALACCAALSACGGSDAAPKPQRPSAAAKARFDALARAHDPRACDAIVDVAQRQACAGAIAAGMVPVDDNGGAR